MKSGNYKKASFLLDRLYRNKISRAKKEKLYIEYVKLVRKAAYAGDARAQFELGQFYEDVNFLGLNKLHNPYKCFYWYSKACEGNHAEACNSLGYCYDTGKGVKKNVRMAKKFYVKSVRLGSVLGKNNLKLM